MKNQFLKILFVICLVQISINTQAQSVGINDDGSMPNPSAILDVNSIDKGLLIPRTDTAMIVGPVSGLMMYQISDDRFYYFNGSNWISFNSQLFDADNDTGLNVEQTADDDLIRVVLKGKEFLRFERNNYNVGRIHTEGVVNKNNVFFGNNVGVNTGMDSTFVNSGKFNTGIGDFALQSNTNGLSNTAVGCFAMANNTIGLNNTSMGWYALGSNIDGNNNTAIGTGALGGNIDGSGHTAIGLNALTSNKIGLRSVAVGFRAGVFDTSSLYNVYLGANSGAGGQVQSDIHKKQGNLMAGYSSGENNQGDYNIFLGYKAGQNELGSNKLYIENSDADENNALIYGDFATNLLRVNGSLNINDAYTFPTGDGLSGRVLKTNGSGTASWQIDNNGYWTQTGAGELYYTVDNVGIGITNPNNKLHIVDNVNADFVSKIDNQNTETKSSGLEIEIGPTSNVTTSNVFIGFRDGNGTAIGSITGDGSGGVQYNTTSDQRLKQNIKPFSKGISLINNIEAYTYEMKTNPGTQHIGFIAQEMYEVLPQIVKGSPSTTDVENPMMIDYSKMVPVLLAATKELIEENERLNAKVTNLEQYQNIVIELQKQLLSQQALLEDLTTRVKGG